jgi:hypothetical protein
MRAAKRQADREGSAKPPTRCEQADELEERMMREPGEPVATGSTPF